MGHEALKVMFITTKGKGIVFCNGCAAYLEEYLEWLQMEPWMSGLVVQSMVQKLRSVTRIVRAQNQFGIRLDRPMQVWIVRSDIDQAKKNMKKNPTNSYNTSYKKFQRKNIIFRYIRYE